MSKQKEPKKHECPLCGQDNNCCVEQELCWCHKLTFNPQTLKQVPEQDQGKRCICFKCASKTSKQ